MKGYKKYGSVEYPIRFLQRGPERRQHILEPRCSLCINVLGAQKCSGVGQGITRIACQLVHCNPPDQRSTDILHLISQANLEIQRFSYSIEK